MEDIGKELCERVREVFEQRNSSNSFLVRLKDEIARGTATMRDTSLYSQTLGINLRRAIKEVVTPDELPDSTLYYNIAHSILEPLLRDTYEDVNAVCAEVQRKLDDKVGIHLASQKADFPAERVRAACGSASTRDTAEHGIEVLERTSENITAAFSDDYMKANADFRSRAGLDTYIERRDDGKCCEWCSKLAGRYSYPDKAPRDIFRRHDNCGCTVEYVCSKGRQDVWSKKWQDEQGKAERIAYADGAGKPTKLSGKEAAELEKRLTSERESGRIKYAKVIDSVFYADDYEYKTYTKEEIIEHLKTSPVGLECIRYLEANPQVKLMLTESREETIRGQHDKDLLTIWLSNCPNVRVAAQTVVHEVTHHKYNIGGSQLAETICYSFEKMHKEGRGYVTQEEWDTLAALAKKVYWDLPAEGGVDHLERFNFIIKER